MYLVRTLSSLSVFGFLFHYLSMATPSPYNTEGMKIIRDVVVLYFAIKLMKSDFGIRNKCLHFILVPVRVYIVAAIGYRYCQIVSLNLEPA
jgi:hypothetical protein